MQPLLTIQIPYTDERKPEVDKLGGEILRQLDLYGLKHVVDVDLDGRGREVSIGQKRTEMYQQSTGLFTVQWDSDDWMDEAATHKIVQAIRKNPDVDCVTYQEHVHINGVDYTSRHSIEYEDWEGDGSKILSDGFSFHRTPYMKDVIRTDIAKSIPVPDCRFGEDHQWSKLIKPLLKTEIHIPEEIYHYIYITNQTFEERYGHDGK